MQNPGPVITLLYPLVWGIAHLSPNTSFGVACGAQAHPYLGSAQQPPGRCFLQSVCLYLAGEGCYKTAPDGVHRPPCHRYLPDRRRYVAGAEGAEGGPHGGHPHRGVCALLVSFLCHRAHQSAVLLGHPCHLEEHLPVVGLFQLLLQPSHLHSIQQELQQCFQGLLLQATVRGHMGVPSSHELLHSAQRARSICQGHQGHSRTRLSSLLCWCVGSCLFRGLWWLMSPAWVLFLTLYQQPRAWPTKCPFLF